MTPFYLFFEWKAIRQIVTGALEKGGAGFYNYFVLETENKKNEEHISAKDRMNQEENQKTRKSEGATGFRMYTCSKTVLASFMLLLFYVVNFHYHQG